MRSIAIVTRDMKAATTASRWATQYINWTRDSDKQKISRKLRALGAHPLPDDVDNIIGNGSWTRPPACGACGNDDHTPRIVFDDNYQESALCFPCIDLAQKLISAHKE